MSIDSTLSLDDNESLADEDKEWRELQKSVKKDKEKESTVQSHPVHAPYFPAVRKRQSMKKWKERRRGRGWGDCVLWSGVGRACTTVWACALMICKSLIVIFWLYSEFMYSMYFVYRIRKER